MHQHSRNLFISTSEGLIGRSLFIVLATGSRGDAGVGRGVFR